MEITEMQDKIQELDKRLKILNKNKEQIVGRLAVETQNRNNAVKSLRELGHDVESMSIAEIKELRNNLEQESEKVLAELETKLEEAESLISKFRSI